MVSKTILAAVAGLSTASAYHQGFNYAATDDFASKFALAKNLVGTDGGFTSARLYTSLVCLCASYLHRSLRSDIQIRLQMELMQPLHSRLP